MMKIDLPGPGKLRCLALSPNCNLLAGSYDSKGEYRLLVWDVAQHTLKHDIASDVGGIDHVVFGSDSNHLAYGGIGGGSVLAGPKFERVSFARFGHAFSVHLSPDNKLVAFTQGHRGVVRLWDIATNREVAVLKYPTWPGFVRFSNDGQALLVLKVGGVEIWDLTANHERIVVGAHAGGTPGVTFSPDGKFLATAGKDRRVRIWDPATGVLKHELPGFSGEVETVAFSSDGKLLATCAHGGDIRFWQVPSWQELPAPDHTLGPQINAGVFSPDGLFFGACGSGGLMMWKVVAHPSREGPKNQPWLQQIGKPSDRHVSRLSFSADGKLLTWTPAISDPRLRVWDVTNSQPYPFPPIRPRIGLRNVAFYRDRNQLALISKGGGPEVWDVVTRQRVYPSGPDDFRGATESGPDGYIALSADDAWLAASGARGTVTVWDLRARKLLLTLPEEHGQVWCMA
jgi:WD40 repeat protein